MDDERRPLLGGGGAQRTKVSRYHSTGEITPARSFVTAQHQAEAGASRTPVYIDPDILAQSPKRFSKSTRVLFLATAMFLYLLATLYFTLAAVAVQTVVDVGHTRYRGLAGTDGISSWKGMRYANRPIGNLRFQAPQDPPGDGRIQDAFNVSLGMGRIEYAG